VSEPEARRRRTVVALAATVLASVVVLGAVGAADAGQATKIRVGNLVVTAADGIAPTALPKTTPAPVSLSAAGGVETTEGTHPPAPERVVIEEDRHVAMQTRGIPTCAAPRLQSEDSAGALANCRPALVGEGTVDFEIAFAGDERIANRSQLLIFNGGEANGVTTLLIHAFVTIPVRAAVVVPLQIKRVRRGRYGLLMVAQVPKIAGGSGSVTHFNLAFDRLLGHGRPGVFAATCTDGRLQTRITTRFVGGQTVRGELVRGCAPRGGS
jgi:hypothetical protein